MSNITVFNPQSIMPFNPQAGGLIESSTFQGLASSAPPRISANKGGFQLIVNGSPKGDKFFTMDVVVVGLYPSARDTYRLAYEGIYKEGDTPVVACYSNDGKTPNPKAKSIPMVQMPDGSMAKASSCEYCPNNIKGSGANGTKKCGYGKNLAVIVPATGDNTVYQLRLSAKAIFGELKNGWYGLNELAKYLASYRIAPEQTVVRLGIPEGQTEGIRFQPVGMLDQATAQQMLAIGAAPETREILELHIDDSEAAEPAPSAQAAAPVFAQQPVHPAFVPPVQQPAYQQPAYQAPVQQPMMPPEVNIYAQQPVQQPVYQAPVQQPVQQPAFVPPQVQQAPAPVDDNPFMALVQNIPTATPAPAPVVPQNTQHFIPPVQAAVAPNINDVPAPTVMQAATTQPAAPTYDASFAQAVNFGNPPAGDVIGSRIDAAFE